MIDAKNNMVRTACGGTIQTGTSKGTLRKVGNNTVKVGIAKAKFHFF